MKIRKKVIVLFIVFMAVIANFIFVNTAYAIDVTDTPSIKSIGVNSSVTPSYSKYPTDHYNFDTKKFGLTELWAAPFDGLSSVLFMFNVAVTKITSFLLMCSFKLNIFSYIQKPYNSIVWNIRDAIFTPFIAVLICIAGVKLVLNIAQHKFSSAYSTIFNVVLILAVAFAFFNNPAGAISAVNDVSMDTSNDILSKTATTVVNTQSSDDAAVTFANVYFDSTVTQAWQLIEFGDIKGSEAEKDKILKYSKEDMVPTGQTEVVFVPLVGPAIGVDGTYPRKDEASKYSNNYLFGVEGAFVRLFMVILFGIVMLIKDAMVLLMSAIILICEFAAIFCSIILIIAFLVALLPGRDFRTVLNVLSNTLSFTFSKIMFSIIMCIYLAFNQAIMNLLPQFGFLMIGILQIFLAFGIYYFRHKIFSFLSPVGCLKNGNDMVRNQISEARSQNQSDKNKLKNFKDNIAHKFQMPNSYNRKKVNNSNNTNSSSNSNNSSNNKNNGSTQSQNNKNSKKNNNGMPTPIKRNFNNQTNTDNSVDQDNNGISEAAAAKEDKDSIDNSRNAANDAEAENYDNDEDNIQDYENGESSQEANEVLYAKENSNTINDNDNNDLKNENSQISNAENNGNNEEDIQYRENGGNSEEANEVAHAKENSNVISNNQNNNSRTNNNNSQMNNVENESSNNDQIQYHENGGIQEANEVVYAKENNNSINDTQNSGLNKKSNEKHNSVMKKQEALRNNTQMSDNNEAYEVPNNTINTNQETFRTSEAIKQKNAEHKKIAKKVSTQYNPESGIMHASVDNTIRTEDESINHKVQKVKVVKVPRKSSRITKKSDTSDTKKKLKPAKSDKPAKTSKKNNNKDQK